MALTHVLRPIAINGLEIKNRILRAAHGTSYGRGTINDDLIAYHLMYAKGGVGLSTLEASVVHQSASNHTINVWDDSIIPGFARIADAVRPHGMRLFVQLWHGGHRWPPADGSPGWSASTVPNHIGGVPIEMSEDEVAEIVAAFAAAAVRAREGGLDGVEVHFGHGYLVQQFLSPLTNRREDGYGGSFDNRLRFGREILHAIRRATGADYPLGIRISDNAAPGGFTPEDGAEVVRRLCAERLVDFVNASMGSQYSVAAMLPAAETPTGVMLPSARPMIAAATVPTMIAGRYRTLEEADQAIREGSADMVAIVRAMIADPELVTKTLAGRGDQVRPCIGCNQGCVAGIRTAAQRMVCAVNPALGFERTLSESLIVKSSNPKTVVVVGGGVGGMEAARLAALCGHRVILFEAQPRLGGAIAIAKRAPRLHAIGDIAHWLEAEIYRQGVDVRLSSYAEAEEVLAEQPFAVIVATGSLPRMDGIQVMQPGLPARGVEQSHVHSSHDVFDIPAERLGRSALVLDDVGHYEAIGVAEHLIERGLKVTFVTRHSSFAPAMELAARHEPALRRLRKGDFTLVTRGLLAEIRPGVCGVRFLDAETLFEVPADTVVLVTHNQPQTAIYRALRDAKKAGRDFTLKIVGDAHAPRDLMAAIREGHMAGRFLDA